jgi:5-(carboxyamino)imidazole ribonucleotide synthase
MMVVPGQWLGVLGGGQLGRMFCQAAQSMGYRVMVLDPEEQNPTAALADAHVLADYDDEESLAELARNCLAVTTEFENVPAVSLQRLAQQTHVSPSARAVELVQDRCVEKAFIQAQGVLVAPYVAVHSLADLQNAPADLFPGILKVARLGYDGKGQYRVATREEALAAFASMGEVNCVLEARLDLKAELSVVLARDVDGNSQVFPVARNVHHDGILAVTHVDGQDSALTTEAISAATRIAEGLGYHGVMCVEFFVLKDNVLLVNEVAPRPHNSGHFTLNACSTSQFEQQARVMAGLPLGDTRLLSPAVMLNLLGDVWLSTADNNVVEPDWQAVLALPGTSLHLYGKVQARRGRKMGHINITASDISQAVKIANEVVSLLRLPALATMPTL